MFLDRRILFLFIGVYALSLLWGLWSFPFVHKEPRNAVIALEMELTGDYMKPTYMGEPYYKKPPLYNTISALLFGVFGVHRFFLRIISVASLAVCVFFIFQFLVAVIGSEAAFFAALSFGVSVICLFLFGVIGEMDMMMTLFLFMGMMYREKYIASGIFLFLGVMTGGFFSLLVFYVVLLAYGYVSRRFLIRGEIFRIIPVVIGFFAWVLLNVGFDIHRIDYVVGFYVENFLHMFSLNLASVIIRFVEFPICWVFYFLPFSLFVFIALDEDIRSEVKSLLRDISNRDLLVFTMISVCTGWVLFALSGNIGYMLFAFVFSSVVVGVLYYCVESVGASIPRLPVNIAFVSLLVVSVVMLLFQVEFVKGMGYLSLLVFVIAVGILWYFIKGVDALVVVLFIPLFTRLIYSAFYIPYVSQFLSVEPAMVRVVKEIKDLETKSVMTDVNDPEVLFYLEKGLGTIVRRVSVSPGVVVTYHPRAVYKIVDRVDLGPNIIYIAKK